MYFSTRLSNKILPRISSFASYSQYAKPCNMFSMQGSRIAFRQVTFRQLLRLPALREVSNMRPLSMQINSKGNDSTITIQDASVLNNTGMLEVKWNDGSSDTYPFVWLRDNCQSPTCFAAVSGSRIFLTRNLLLDDKPSNVQISKCGSSINIEWPDGHESTYLSSWLNERAFNMECRNKRYTNTLRLPSVHWGSELLDDLPISSLEEVLANDKALLKWLTQLEVYGITVMQDAGTEGGQIERLAHRVEKIRTTHYGSLFSVRTKPQPNNAAYNSGPLQLHLDLPFYSHVPGIQLLHCLQQASTGAGGESEFVDGVHVANKMREESPQLFQVLRNTEVDFWDVGRDKLGYFNKIMQHPTFRVNHRGDIIAIHFNNAVRDSFMDASAEEVQLWYRAYKLYHDMLYHSDNYMSWKMKPGTLVTFDNTRVFHGRQGFKASEDRELEGGYIDWDEVRSKRRVLNNKFEGVQYESTCGEDLV